MLVRKSFRFSPAERERERERELNIVPGKYTSGIYNVLISIES
jgi:hypothetical protein